MRRCLWCAARFAFYELFPSLQRSHWDLYCLRHEEEAVLARLHELIRQVRMSHE